MFFPTLLCALFVSLSALGQVFVAPDSPPVDSPYIHSGFFITSDFTEVPISTYLNLEGCLRQPNCRYAAAFSDPSTPRGASCACPTDGGDGHGRRVEYNDAGARDTYVSYNQYFGDFDFGFESCGTVPSLIPVSYSYDGIRCALRGCNGGSYVYDAIPVHYNFTAYSFATGACYCFNDYSAVTPGACRSDGSDAQIYHQRPGPNQVKPSPTSSFVETSSSLPISTIIDTISISTSSTSSSSEITSSEITTSTFPSPTLFDTSSSALTSTSTSFDVVFTSSEVSSAPSPTSTIESSVEPSPSSIGTVVSSTTVASSSEIVSQLLFAPSDSEDITSTSNPAPSIAVITSLSEVASEISVTNSDSEVVASTQTVSTPVTLTSTIDTPTEFPTPSATLESILILSTNSESAVFTSLSISSAPTPEVSPPTADTDDIVNVAGPGIVNAATSLSGGQKAGVAVGSIAGAAVLATLGILIAKGVILGAATGLGIGAAAGGAAGGGAAGGSAGGATSGANAATQMGTAATANSATATGASSGANAPVYQGVPLQPSAPVATGTAAAAGGAGAAAASGAESQWGTAALPFRRPVSNDEENQVQSPFLDPPTEERDRYGRLIDN